MNINFQHQTIGDLFSLTNGFAFPSKEFVASGIPVLKIKNVKAGEMRFDDLSYVDRRFLSERAEKIAKRRDLLVTMSGNRLDGTPETWVGKVAEFNRDEPYLVNQRVGILRAHPNVHLIPRYFAYVLSSPEYQKLFISIATSSGGQANLSPSQILSAPVDVPEVSVQEAIADAVGSLDDKIEQNRRTGAKLEALGRAVFKAWFVDFEPVKAKAAGATAFPGMPAETFAALPTRLIDSDLGPVPQGWEARSLYSVAKFINGAAFKNSHFCEPSVGLPVVKIAELKSGVTGQTKFSNRTDLDARYQIDTGDVLYSWSGSPDTSLDTFIWTKGPGLLNQHIFRVVTESDERKTFVYYLLKHLKQDLIEIARNKQTTGLGHVTVGDMQRLLLAWPSGDVIEAFHQVTGPVFAVNFNGLIETEKLAALRDYLLPRLLSGTVRVAEGESQVGGNE